MLAVSRTISLGHVHMRIFLLVHVLSDCLLHTAVVIVGCEKCRRPWLPIPCMLFGSLVKRLSVPICVWHCAVYRQPELLLYCHRLLLQVVSVCAVPKS